MNNIVAKLINGKLVDLSEEESKKHLEESNKRKVLKGHEFEYQRDRAESYDPIPEQLDQIFHDIDGWKARIKSVKDKYPKP
jgi:hypothetical protein